MFPEISAQWSLLEPSFRYLSPGNEGKICRPRPFVTDPFHPLGSLCNKRSFLHLYQGVSVISSMWYVKVRLVRYLFDTCACVPFRKTRLEVQNDKSSFSPPIGNVFTQNTMHFCMCIFWTKEMGHCLVLLWIKIRAVFSFVVTKDSKEKAVLSKAKKWNGD